MLKGLTVATLHEHRLVGIDPEARLVSNPGWRSRCPFGLETSHPPSHTVGTRQSVSKKGAAIVTIEKGQGISTLCFSPQGLMATVWISFQPGLRVLSDNLAGVKAGEEPR